MKTTAPTSRPDETDVFAQVLSSIESACAKIPPLWPLRNFVAVNPFLGISSLNFAEATRLIHAVTHDHMTLPPSTYAEAFARGEITEADLTQAASRLSRNGTPATAAALHLALAHPWVGEWPILTLADQIDRKTGTRWGAFITEEVSKWCAAYHDDGQALWAMPWRTLPLFRAWKRAAGNDLTPGVSGLAGFRASLEHLPDDAPLAIQQIVESLALPPTHWDIFLHRQLMTVRGWAGYLQYLTRENKLRGRSDDRLVQLLAIRLAYDFALHRAFRLLPEVTPPAPVDTASWPVPPLAVWQEALEIAQRRTRLAPLLAKAGTSTPDADARPAFQAVFCIDVRSEVFRRALESAAPQAETLGFAGFFGFPLEVVPLAGDSGAARCPVLLLPTHKIQEKAAAASPAAEISAETRLKKQKSVHRHWKYFKSACVTSFPFVESLGLAYVSDLVRDSLARPRQVRPQPTRLPLDPCASGCGHDHGIPLGDRPALAEGALRNMGLIRNFARLILICGHGSRTANNPFGASLDCGACGGHAGDANARIAAAVLNEPAVRHALAQRGLQVPDDTVFVAALHNTTTDEVEIFDPNTIPPTHHQDLAQLRAALEEAGKRARAERGPGLGLAHTSAAPLRQAIEKRARDWSQVRPEWGLAGNDTFIAAPRARTRGLKLHGRAFLHNYDYQQDPEDKILELILCAPVVVASWINLQYFGSAANNALFGSGNKVLHNVVGRIGVIEGNGGDLRGGLPWQSVHNGHALVHLPLRLNVIIEAPRERIDAVLARQPGVRELVDHQWIHLHAWEDEGRTLRHRHGPADWQAWHPE
jgi:uncharacterized protein YbcC (UPF0753/DUF2309 family)